MPPLPDRVAVLGCGLVGASLAADWSAAGIEVWGCDRRDLAPLVGRGWLARQVGADELAAAPVVVLALPVPEIVGALARLPVAAGQVLTDTGGVKRPVLAAAARLPRGASFVGGHPMAGGTGSGYEAARPGTFAGAAWALVPSPGASPGAIETVAGLVRAAGGEPVPCSADEHDRIVALTSHLPQLLASAIAAELAGEGGDLAVRLVGPAGRDLLRLAASPFELWRGVLAANRDEVLRALAQVTGRAEQPPAALGPDFAAARELAARLLARADP